MEVNEIVKLNQTTPTDNIFEDEDDEGYDSLYYQKDKPSFLRELAGRSSRSTSRTTRTTTSRSSRSGSSSSSGYRASNGAYTYSNYANSVNYYNQYYANGKTYG